METVFERDRETVEGTARNASCCVVGVEAFCSVKGLAEKDFAEAID